MNTVTLAQGEKYFLQQAYRNNWQGYQNALTQTGTEASPKKFWDICVLTASDARQTKVYEAQLAWRLDAGLLPKQTEFMVIADPAGQRIGSGGATLRVLTHLLKQTRRALNKLQVLIIHSGGDSKRLPHCSAIGKLFARIPRILPDGRASTMFDEFFISLSNLPSASPPGVLVASGDVLLLFDHLQLNFHRQGITGVAIAAAPELGTRHGVFVSQPQQTHIHTYLHKPSLPQLQAASALDDEGQIQIDTGLVWFAGTTVPTLLSLADEPRLKNLYEPQADTSAQQLNLYGDLLMPLAEETNYDAYLQDTSDGPLSRALQLARELIWARLRSLPFHVQKLKPALFIHFGFSAEYWRMVADDADLADLCAWTSQTASWPQQTVDNLVSINSSVNLDKLDLLAQAKPALVSDSLIENSLQWQGRCLLANLHTQHALNLAPDIAIHQLPIENKNENGFVTRIFGLDDDAKRPYSDATATIFNLSWSTWLKRIHLSPDEIWPDLPQSDWTLWQAKLYPLSPNREDSLRLSLGLHPEHNRDDDWLLQWQNAPRLSLANGFALADSEGLLEDILHLRDVIAVKHFRMGLAQELPAVDLKHHFYEPDRLAQRRELLEAWLQTQPPLLNLRAYKAVTEATGEPKWEDKAFTNLVHLIEEAVLAQNLDSSVTVQAIPGKRVRVEAAARIDFGGGWSDTPPYSLERGGAVLNAALTLQGAYPIIVEAEWLTEPKIILESRDIETSLVPEYASDVLAYANPADPFALLKSALVLRGFIPKTLNQDMPIADIAQTWGGGLKLSTQTNIPRGSGLGTSSIMAGAVLSALARLLQIDLTEAQLFDEVLYLEQMMTTGGGWQDQVGGLVGGIKLVYSQAGLPQKLTVDSLSLSPQTQNELSQRLLLVYTGQQRLAKNLLRAVMGRWMARDQEMVWILGEIVRLAWVMKDALERDDVDTFGRLLAEHWELNKRMDPGCTNPFINQLFEDMAPYIHGGKLAGAGGGGFAFVVAKSEQAAQNLEQVLTKNYAQTGAGVWNCAIPVDALKYAA